jgi:hypothetical protein
VTWEMLIPPVVAVALSTGIGMLYKRSAKAAAETQTVLIVEQKIAALRHDLNGHLDEVNPLKTELHETTVIANTNREIIVRIEKAMDRMFEEQKQTNIRLDMLIDAGVRRNTHPA